LEKLFLSREDFANALGISLSSVNRGWKEKKWPFNGGIKIGRRVLFPSSSLPEYTKVLAKCEVSDAR